MINSEKLIAYIDGQIASYDASKTEHNKEFVEGVVYGLLMAKANAKAAIKLKFPLQEDNYERD